jgi:hypothetical protein
MISGFRILLPKFQIPWEELYDIILENTHHHEKGLPWLGVDFDCSTSLCTLIDSALAYIVLSVVSLPMQLVVECSPPLSRSTLCAHSIRLIKVDARHTR